MSNWLQNKLDNCPSPTCNWRAVNFYATQFFIDFPSSSTFHFCLEIQLQLQLHVNNRVLQLKPDLGALLLYVVSDRSLL